MDVPGRADQVSDEIKARWGEYVSGTYDAMKRSYPSRFFRRSARELRNPVPLKIRWFAEPLEPRRCLGEEAARSLCDWGVEGRYNLHDEYCEYHVTYALDAAGELRPKRVEVTTELREFWVLVAEHDPRAVRAMAAEVLGFEPRWRELYGVDDPLALAPRVRRRMFAREVAGNGNFEKGVPDRPQGGLNLSHLLFMAVGVNGLDDLFFIHMFGSLLYAVDAAGGRRPATRDEIFLQRSRPDLSCRNSDPEAALTTQREVHQGRPVAFADPLGIYLHSFAREKFVYKDEVIPERWVRWRRGQPGMFQRLEVGPGDDEAVFLDDITVCEGAEESRLEGGYQIARNVEVGPLAVVGEAEAIQPDDHVLLNASDEKVDCLQGDLCKAVRDLKARYDAAHAPRTGMRGGAGNVHG